MFAKKYKIANSTYYELKVKYAGMNAIEVKRLKTLVTENQRLRSMYTGMNLDREILEAVLEKSILN